MDVSNQPKGLKKQKDLPGLPEISELNDMAEETTDDLGGTELINRVVSLTGLPESLVHQEVQQILETAGTDAGALTLDDLRTAMLAYLEMVQKDLSAASLEEPESLLPSDQQ